MTAARPAHSSHRRTGWHRGRSLLPRASWSAGRWQASLGAALESDRGHLVIAGVGVGLVLLVGLAVAVRAPSPERPLVPLLSLFAALGVAFGLALRPSRPLAATVTTAATILVLAAFARFSFLHAPSVVWLFAFVIPAIGLARGPAQGTLAGLLSEPALGWIELGTPLDGLDPQTPFGFLILAALGFVPAYLLSVAVRRRAALDEQLERVNVLLGETEAARDAEGRAKHQTVFMLARAAEARDGTTGIHIQSVCNLAEELALAAGVQPEAVREIAWSAMLHDVGKLRVPDRVLLKPGSLTDEEWELIRQHPAWGEELLSGAEGFALARAIARSHHENWDGTGYPDRLVGTAIPFAARIVRIVDVFDALRSDRPYKPAWSLERTLDEIRLMRGRGFDPELTDLFLELAASRP